MPIFDLDDRRVLFLHIPKAAGSSMTKWLSGHGKVSFFRPRPVPPLSIPPQHLRWRDFDYLLNDPVFDYAFTVVRNPYDRIESEYFWAHRNADTSGQPWDDFNSWVERQIKAVRNNPFHASNHLSTQVSFLADPVEVFKFEDGMEQITAQIAKTLGIAPPDKVPYQNARAKKARKLTWSVESIDLVRDFYAADFKTLGYDPDGRSVSA